MVSKILLVEDNKLTRMVTERSLAKAGFCVVCAMDGEQALDRAANDSPDVVLLDMMLPKLSGPDVLRRLKSNPVTAKIPVIVLSGLSQKNQDRLVEEGATAFVEKNDYLSEPDILFSAIRLALKAAREAHGLATNPTALPPALSIHLR
jgi:CheY-like chemotaxis protein